MRDLGLLHRSLEAEGQRLEAHDPRFLHITELARAHRYPEAADAVAELLAEDLYDVRLLGYYLFAAFHEAGLARLPDVLETLAALIQRNWAALPPGDKRAVLLGRSVTWLSQTLLDTLKYHQAKKDERWSGWMRGLSEDGVLSAARRGQEVLALLPGPTYQSSAEVLAQLLQWLRELAAVLAAQAAAPPAPAPEPSGNAPAPAALPAPGADASLFLVLGQAVQLRGSALFVELNNKLKAFELLVEDEAFEKAALVGDDILATLESFDPRRYFPDLFATFGALLSRHVQDIQPHWERKDTLEWKTLSQFYQVDLRGFVERK